MKVNASWILFVVACFVTAVIVLRQDIGTFNVTCRHVELRVELLKRKEELRDK
jgi:hypothetical protein